MEAPADDELVISADSHVIEDPHLFEQRLPQSLRGAAPVFPERGVGGQFQTHPGGFDPDARVGEMAVDGVSQEILYPSLTMNLFGLTDPVIQEACFRVYNDWLSEYCAAAPDRLFGIAALSVYGIDHAVVELERCAAAGFVGAMVWEAPPEELSFATSHYDPLWEAASALGMPVSLHSLTGAPYVWPRPGPKERELHRSSRKVNQITLEGANAISDLITTAVPERFPGLHFVLVENEASWIPFFLSRYDNYFGRSARGLARAPVSELTLAPSEYFARQFHATFFDDPTLGSVLRDWGADLCMWSNDFPHANSTWPHSREVIARDLGHLPAADRRRVVAGNAAALYGLPDPVGVITGRSSPVPG